MFPPAFIKKAGFALLIANLAFIHFRASRPNQFELRMEMSSSVPGLAQLFFDTGAGFNEAESRLVSVTSSSVTSFETFTFDLPGIEIQALRFDPLQAEGRMILRHVRLTRGDAILHQFAPEDLLPLHQIGERRIKNNGEVEFATDPGANDPMIRLETHGVFRSNGALLGEKIQFFGAGNAVIILLLFLYSRFREPILRPWRRANSWLTAKTCSFTSSEFLPLDSIALWFYVACVGCFLFAVCAGFNGSSAPLYHSVNHHGQRQDALYGSPREIRSDEWGYTTPAILNQALRKDAFATEHSAFGDHSVALVGNAPVKHVSTLFRPQFWGFFFLPVEVAFSIYWQAKAFILVTGVFTWLLLITRSSSLAIVGSLWYFFSPFTQWTYSWPSALPEITGYLCWTIVFASYLTVGANRVRLVLAALGATMGAVNFALSGYLPHLVPLAWLAVLSFAAFLMAQRKSVFRSSDAASRIAAWTLVLVLLTLVGANVYRDLQYAISAIAQTSYPGKRVSVPGTFFTWQFPAGFFLWFQNEKHLPPVLGNISEGAGYLWLAPAMLFAWRRLELNARQRWALIGLWAAALLLFAWLCLPVPAIVGSLTGLNRTIGARALPALGLANVAIVILSVSALPRLPRFKVLYAALILAAFWSLLAVTNVHLEHFYSRRTVFLASLAAAILTSLALAGLKRIWAVVLILSQSFVSADINPVERGLDVFTRSQLAEFSRANPFVRDGKWIVFSGAVVCSGFLRAVGLDVYTGDHYLPDVDHFALFRSRNLDLAAFNRLGYLTATAQTRNLPVGVEVHNVLIVEWKISPTDPLLRQLGIRYVAFDGVPDPATVAGLEPLSNRAVDGFWLYRLP